MGKPTALLQFQVITGVTVPKKLQGCYGVGCKKQRRAKISSTPAWSAGRRSCCRSGKEYKEASTFFALYVAWRRAGSFSFAPRLNTHESNRTAYSAPFESRLSRLRSCPVQRHSTCPRRHPVACQVSPGGDVGRRPSASLDVWRSMRHAKLPEPRRRLGLRRH